VNSARPMQVTKNQNRTFIRWTRSASGTRRTWRSRRSRIEQMKITAAASRDTNWLGRCEP
jgi:hypothetical protein